LNLKPSYLLLILAIAQRGLLQVAYAKNLTAGANGLRRSSEGRRQKLEARNLAFRCALYRFATINWRVAFSQPLVDRLGGHIAGGGKFRNATHNVGGSLDGSSVDFAHIASKA
jgi:hypothetical protein